MGDRQLYLQTDLAHGTFTWGYSFTDGQGNAATLAAGLDLSTSYLPWLHATGQVQLTNTLDAPGKLHSDVSFPFSTLSGQFRF